MINGFLKKIVGTKNERELKKIQPIVNEVNGLESKVRELSDAELQRKTIEFKERLDRGARLDDILVETFAVVREVSKRVLNMRHFDVQLIGGVVLHEGKIAEMATGEGKTLVATLPVYLNALTGKGVHVVTVNDYLAKRDSEWMGEIYKFLGLRVGLIQHDMEDKERQEAYKADVIYGTNNEFGFDYLRDNMKFDLGDYVQGELNYAIVDEVDSILIDEARTPLIISGPTEESTDKYYKINRIIPRFKKEADYQMEEKTKTISLTEEGVVKAEGLLNVDNLYDSQNIELVHHINQALKAHKLFSRDVDYVVRDGEVLIVDEFTGRLMPGRRYSEGLHQALEAKEGVEIAKENQTLASITFQNYFRLYNKLAGMTGTADTEAAEFKKIYNLDVMVIPTNRFLCRTNYQDVIYRTEKEKFNAVANEIIELYEIGRPILVGTISIEKSEKLSSLLKRRGVKHHVLNAKHHEREAEIISQAGQRQAVTIATNMAGRGTDIVLGEGVTDLDGLHIIATERHESRRIDNQLRGRSGRQGDPGSSKFYLSLEDDLLRIFGSERISSIMSRIGMEEGQPIEHKFITKAIESAQRKVEGHNFEIRKHLLEYDDVMNKQREVIYEQRRQVLGEQDRIRENIFEMIEELLNETITTYAGASVYSEEWDLKGLKEALSRQFSLELSFPDEEILKFGQDKLKETLLDLIHKTYLKKEKDLGESRMRFLERMVMLQVIDSLWKDHLYAMDHLKEGIGLRGYGQKNPLTEYKKEGFEMFMNMIEHIKKEIIEYLFKVQAVTETEVSKGRRIPRGERTDTWGLGFQRSRNEELQGNRGGEEKPKPFVRKDQKVGRNDPCPCGSGKKYKKCCGA